MTEFSSQGFRVPTPRARDPFNHTRQVQVRSRQVTSGHVRSMDFGEQIDARGSQLAILFLRTAIRSSIEFTKCLTIIYYLRGTFHVVSFFFFFFFFFKCCCGVGTDSLRFHRFCVDAFLCSCVRTSCHVCG